MADGGVQEEELDIAKEESDVIGDDDDVDDDDIDRMKMMTSTSSPTSSDHTLPLACNLERYAESDNIFNRQMVARSLLDTLRSVVDVEDDVATVLSVLLRLSEDIEPSVRAELVEQVPHIAAFCQEHSTKGLEDVLPRYLLPLVMKYLADPNNQVRKTSQAALLSLLEQKLLKQGEVQDQVCPVVIQMADLENLDHYRTEAVMLMSRMATLVGKDLTQNLFLDRFVVLCSDSSFQVRKVCAIHFGDLCSVMETEITENVLLPRFIMLCSDGMWGVRKACADVFVSVACMCTLATRRQHLADVFVPLLSDQSRWVRVAAYQALGPFISTFADPSTQRLCCYDQEGNVHVAVDPNEDGADDMCFNEQYLGDEGAGSGRHPTDPIETKDVCAEGEDGRVADLLEGGDSGFSSREASNAGSPSEEARSEVSVDEEWTGVVTRNEERTVISGLSSSSSAPSSAVQHLHVDHQDCFNSFEYWRDPIPDIKLDIDLVEGRAAGIHVRSQVYDEQRRKTFSSELDVVVSDSQPGELEAALEKVTLVQRRDGDDGGERVVLRIVGPAKEVTASLGRPLAQYIPAPPVRPGITLQEFSSQAIIPHDLLHHYVQMIDPAHLQTMDNEVVRFCAHSLPAVALTLGRKYWPLLRHLYETLASDMQWKVRRTLAFSIHELAAILGQRLAASDLVPIFNNFVRDLDEVRIGILRHLARFLSFLPASERVAFLPKIQDFLEPENERNWRFRLELADQLSLLSPLFGGREVAAHLVPVSIRLLQDRVAEVRTAAADTLAHLAQRLSINTALLLSSPHSSSYDRARCLGGVGGGKDLLVPLAKDLVSCFARHSKWHQRQTYANVCRRLKYTFPGPVFLAHLLPALLELSGDPVANVRLAVAKALSDVSLPPFTPLAVQELCGSDFQEHKFDDDDDDEDDEDNNNDAEEDANYKRSSILRAMERLRHDRDRDVRQAAAASSSSTASVSSPTHAPPLFAAPLVTASSAVFPWCQAPGPTSAVNDAGLASASCLVTASNANAECAAK